MIIPFFPRKPAVSKGFRAITPLLPGHRGPHPRWHRLWKSRPRALTLQPPCSMDAFSSHRAATKPMGLGKKRNSRYLGPCMTSPSRGMIRVLVPGSASASLSPLGNHITPAQDYRAKSGRKGSQVPPAQRASMSPCALGLCQTPNAAGPTLTQRAGVHKGLCKAPEMGPDPASGVFCLPHQKIRTNGQLLGSP